MAKVRIKQLEDIQASDIYLERDLKVTTKVGEIKSFDPGKQYATVSATRADGSRKTVQEALEEIFSRDTAPGVKSLPSASVTFCLDIEGQDVPVEKGQLVEAGTVIKIVPHATFSPGAYSFGPATGCTMQNCSIQLVETAGDGQDVEVLSIANNGSAQHRVPAEDARGLRLVATIRHSASTANAVTQLGNPSDLAIAAGVVEAQSATLVPALPVFFGAVGPQFDPATDLRNPDTLHTLLLDPSATTPTTLRIAADSGDTQMVLAFPKSLVSAFSATLTSSMGADITANFEQQEDFDLRSADNEVLIGAYCLFLFHPDQMQGNEIVDIILER